MNNDRVLALRLVGDHLCFGPHVDATTARTVSLHDPCTPVNLRPGREVWARDVLHELIDFDIGVLQCCQTPRHHLTEIVRRDIGRHTNGNTRRAVYKQVGHPRWQHCGDSLSAIVVVDKIDCFLVQVCQQGMCNLGHANLGVSHRRSGVSVNGAKITLAVYQRVPQ